MRTGRIALSVALSIGGVVAQSAQAQEYRGTMEQQMACTPDVWRLCGDQNPDVNRIQAHDTCPSVAIFLLCCSNSCAFAFEIGVSELSGIGAECCSRRGRNQWWRGTSSDVPPPALRSRQ